MRLRQNWIKFSRLIANDLRHNRQHTMRTHARIRRLRISSTVENRRMLCMPLIHFNQIHRWRRMQWMLCLALFDIWESFMHVHMCYDAILMHASTIRALKNWKRVRIKKKKLSIFFSFFFFGVVVEIPLFMRFSAYMRIERQATTVTNNKHNYESSRFKAKRIEHTAKIV